MIRSLFTAAFLLSTAVFAQAQAVANSAIKITDIKPTLESSPEFNVTIGPQRKASSKQWLWVEVSFVYQSRTPQPLSELTLNYYILLNDASPQNRLGTLLTGTITHTGVTPGTDVHHSVALISPQTLRQFFGDRVPASPQAAVQAIGVTATVNGQLVAEESSGKGKGRQGWWNNFQQGPPGLVLNKDQTPFAPLFYDYFEAIKAKSAGGY